MMDRRAEAALCGLLMALLATFQVEAQPNGNRGRDSDIQSLLHRDNELSAMGMVDFKFTELIDTKALLLGAKAGMIINKRFLFGLGGYGIASNVQFGSGPNGGQPLQLYGGYAGMLLGGVIAPEQVVHLSIPILLGAGGVEVSDAHYFPSFADSEFTIDRSAFFVVEPGLDIEVNVTRTLRVGIGASYRWVSGADLTTLSDADLTDWSGNFSIRLGGK